MKRIIYERLCSPHLQLNLVIPLQHCCLYAASIGLLLLAGMRAADEGYGMQPSSARASVTSSEGYGPSSRASRAQHEASFGGGRDLKAKGICMSWATMAMYVYVLASFERG